MACALPPYLALNLKQAWIFFFIALFMTSTVAHHTGLTTKILVKIEKKYGMLAKERVIKLDELIHENLTAPEVSKLNLVNDFFNGAKFAKDIDIWKTADYWATPIEFIGRDAGDCEDFSIAKYMH